MNFDKAIERILSHEAGYVFSKRDPGGETRWGISKRSYPAVNIKLLTREQAIAIYKRDFWDRLDMEALPCGAAFQLLDFAVNSGIETAVRALQRAIGVAPDGHWGPVSKARAAVTSHTDLILGILAERLDFMTNLVHWPTYGRGWARRIAENLRFGALDT